MFRSLFVKLGLGFVAREIRNAAEGKHGLAVQKVYLFAQGKKTSLGFLLAVVCGVLVGLGNSGAEVWTSGTLAGLLLSVGLLDKSWRSGPPESWKQTRLYLFASERSHDIAAALGMASLAVSACDPGTSAVLARFYLTCSSAALLLFVLSVVLVQLGLMAEAKLALPPKVAARG